MTILFDDLVDTVGRRPGASFPELESELSKTGHDIRGDRELQMPTRADLVLWTELSEEFCAALSDAKESGRAHAHMLMSDLEVLLIYSFDGGILPIAKRPTSRPYKKPRWLPVVWYPGRTCGASNCLGPRKEKAA